MRSPTSSLGHPRSTEPAGDERTAAGGDGSRPGQATDSIPRRPSGRTAGRQLRTLRLAADLSVEEAAVAVQSTVGRIRELEAGRADLLYLEGLALAKAYLLCSSCFSKHFRLAAARAGVQEEPEEPDAD
jgi:Helix-turn-helix domain